MHDYKPAEHDYSAKISSQSAFVRLNARFFCSSCSYSDKRAFTMTIDLFIIFRQYSVKQRDIEGKSFDLRTETEGSECQFVICCSEYGFHTCAFPYPKTVARRDCHKSVIRKSHNVFDEEKTHCNVKIGRYAAWESEFC